MSHYATEVCKCPYKTTPIPSDKQTWIYDLSKGEVLNPEGCQIPYLHFLFFKKTPTSVPLRDC